MTGYHRNDDDPLWLSCVSSFAAFVVAIILVGLASWVVGVWLIQLLK